MVQLISVTHTNSNLKQAIFFTAAPSSLTGKEDITFQATAFGRTRHSTLTRQRLIETLRVWRDLENTGEIVVTQIDSLTLKALTGATQLYHIEGEVLAYTG